ncbi:hypothetical protein [Caulobacter sp. RHG1]|uniref:hypothetical protein n=1 Tax=Caulobacter sp. (strain RHG1) TaxID=2545762 RepID=UPI0015519506|nr:hypothetical protein [Caulobacter sp. RHG1]NQE64242.1 hypothetical protein [Caulobacter sp. RHG1]
MLEIIRDLAGRTRRAVTQAVTVENRERSVAVGLAVLALLLFHHLVGLGIVSAHSPFWRAPNADMAAMLAGAEAIFQGPWRFPFTLSDRLLAPATISVVYTDSLPWLTLLLKATGAWKIVNPLGLFLLASYVLQPLAMLALLRALGVRQVVFQVLGGVLALLLPAWLLRHGHVALTGHWLILLALAVSVASAREGLTRGRIAAFAALAAVAAGLHAYHLPPIGLAFAAALVSEVAQGRAHALRRSAIAAIVVLASLGASAFVLGYGAAPAKHAAAGMIGYYSMNILGPVLPQGSALFGQTYNGGWFTHTFDASGGQAFEGYAYLGLGVLLLVVSAIRLSKPSSAWVRRWLPLTLAAVALTVAAIGPRPFLGMHLLFEGPQPSGPLAWLGLFRAHGRFFWGAAYLLIAVSTLRLSQLARPITAAVLAVVVLALQIADTSQIRLQTRDSFVRAPGPLHPVELETAPGLRGRPWIFAPTFYCTTDAADRQEIAQLSLTATRTGGTSNGAYTAQDPGQDCTPKAQLFTPAAPGDRRITVALAASLGADIERVAKRGDCQRLPRGLICGRDLGKLPGLEPVLANLRVLATIRFDTGQPAPELVRGWSAPEPTGVWSDGLSASMRLAAPGVRPGAPLVVELHALAFAEPPASQQPIAVSVAGRKLADWKVERVDWRPYTVIVPAEWVGSDGGVTLDFAIPNAKPSTPQDPRRIGLGVQKVVISQPAPEPLAARR